MSNEELMNGTDAANYLGVSKQHVSTLAHSGVIGTLIAGRYVFTRSELDRYALTKKKTGRPAKGSWFGLGKKD